MRAPPELTERAATLIEADPALGGQLGMRATATIGHRQILPVLNVRAGAWVPPARERLGPRTVAVTVLDGFLTVDGALIGPGDAFEPWDAGTWVACTPLRLAIIGRAYAGALKRWPGAVDRLRQRARPRAAPQTTGGTLDDRLLRLLWSIAQRYGELMRSGLALPSALDVPALHLILGFPEVDLALSLAGLRRRGAIDRHRNHWILVVSAEMPGPHARRDELQARTALVLAVARAGREDVFAIGEQLDLELRQREALGGRLGARRGTAPGHSSDAG
jgi:CRP/FNR family cyclic AMP-dependent transcriptional regulator